MNERKDWEEILELPDGVFRVKYHRLSASQLKRLRTRWMNDVWKLRREIGLLFDKIEEKKKLLKAKEALISAITEERIKRLEELERRMKEEAEKRALAFLENYIGEENFQKLQKQGYFTFKGLDGKTYRIKKDGTLQELYSGYWYDCCVVRQNLPLPDFIAAVFTAAKNDPQFLREKRRLNHRERR